jgi:hypothetical protein
MNGSLMVRSDSGQKWLLGPSRSKAYELNSIVFELFATIQPLPFLLAKLSCDGQHLLLQSLLMKLFGKVRFMAWH